MTLLVTAFQNHAGQMLTGGRKKVATATFGRKRTGAEAVCHGLNPPTPEALQGRHWTTKEYTPCYAFLNDDGK